MRESQRTKIPGSLRVLMAFAALCGFAVITQRPSTSAQLGVFDRESAKAMLAAVKEDLKNNYYDANFRGLDLEGRFKQAEDRIKQAQTRDQLIFPIAQVMLDLNDSHTKFLPPFRAARVRYGWQMQMVGDHCFVTNVNPKSDAAAKGLLAGDEVVSVDGQRPTRETLWKMYYRYYALAPTRSVRLLVKQPNSEEAREIEVLSKIEKTAERADFYTNIYRYNSETRLDDDRFHEQGDLLVWQMPGFDILPERVDQLMSRARKYKTLIVDLRGNGGGYKVTLERFVGYFFDHDVKVGELKGRKELKPILAKTQGDKVFKGSLIVLIDSESGSAAELFARVVQLEKRGKVFGDRSAGAVMISKNYYHETGVGGTLYFATQITIADVIMTDGKSLEHSGVIPDDQMLPGPADIAASRDPVLARAAALAGVEITPETAGKLFPIEWLK